MPLDKALPPVSANLPGYVNVYSNVVCDGAYICYGSAGVAGYFAVDGYF